MADTLYSLSGSILGALWQSAIDFFPTMLATISSHDWGNVTLRVIILLVIVVLVYRLIQRQMKR